MTVGPGFSPDLRRSPWKGARGLPRLASITAGGDFHPALRAYVLLMRRGLLSSESKAFFGIFSQMRRTAGAEEATLDLPAALRRNA